MSRTLSKAVVLAIAVVLAAAPFVFAQATTPGSGSTAPGTQERMGPGSTGTAPGSGSTAPGTQERMGTGTMGAVGAQDTLTATVADVNHQHNTVKLKMQGGETVEFKVPEASLTHLNKGDNVQVSIRKAEAHPGMAPSRPESTRPESTTPGSSGTRSR